MRSARFGSPSASVAVAARDRQTTTTKMLRKCLVLALVAVGFAAAGSSRTADMDLLVKQKKIFDLLMYVDKNVLTDAEYFEIGRNYDIMNNIDRYNDKVRVSPFDFE